MYIQTQKGNRLINIERYDYFGVDENQVLAYRGDKYIILGEYETAEMAQKELESLMILISRKIDVYKMDE